MHEHDGLFQAASGGTLFLDEIADLPLSMQVKLLRAIQEKAIRPVGASREVPVDVRLLSATHKDLASLVQMGSFRKDLYYRVNVIELHVPPLRDRREDIPLLLEYCLGRCAALSGVLVPQVSEAARNALLCYAFPGNVRELENILERAMTLCERGIIQEGDLCLPAIGLPAIALPSMDLPSACFPEWSEWSECSDKSPATVPSTSSSGTLLIEEVPPTESVLDPFLDAVERETILHALQETQGNRTHAARILGIRPRVLRYRLKKLGLESQSVRTFGEKAS